MIGAGFVLSPSGVPIAYALLNRTLAVIVLWITAFGLRRLIRDRLTHFQAEQRWQLLAHQTHDILWDWNLRTNAHWWSEKTVTVFGYDPAREPSIEAWQSRLHPDDRDRVLTGIRSAIDDGHPGWTDEYRFRCGDHSYRTMLDRGTIVRDESSAALRMVGAMIDITDRKLAAAEQTRLAVNHLLLLESTSEGIFGIDLDGCCTFINLAGASLLGGTVEHFTGRDLHRFHYGNPPDGAAPGRAHSFIHDTLRTGQPTKSPDDVFRRTDGTAFPVRYSAHPLVKDGTITGAVVVFSDITAQKHLQAALRASEERLARATKGSTDAMWDAHRLPDRSMFDPETPIWWSARIRDLLTLHDSTPFNTLTHWAQRLHAEDAERVFTALQNHFSHRSSFDTDYRLRTDLGTYRWFRARGQATWDEHGQPRCISGSCQDITDRKIAEEALRRSEMQLREAQRIAGVGSWEWTVDSTVSWSDENYRIFGYAPKSIIPSYDLFVESLHPDDRRRVMDALHATLRNDAPYDLVCRIIRPSGELRHIRCRGEVTRHATAEPTRVAGTVEDVTERIRSEEQLRDAYERLQDVTRCAAAAEENERRRIAREIHDELGQLVTAMRFQLTALKKAQKTASPAQEAEDRTARLNDLLGLSDTMLSQVRHVSASLRPAMLDELGLIPAMQTHAQQFEIRTGIACDVVADRALIERAFDDATSSSVFRIVQELLTNVLRHAQAMAVTITFAQDGQTLTVIVQDNGTGIRPTDGTHRGSFGLKGIRERAALLNGTFVIGRNRDEGTIATLRVPLVVLSLPPSVTPQRPHPENHENPVGR